MNPSVFTIDVQGPPKPRPRHRWSGQKIRRDTSADAWAESIREAILEKITVDGLSKPVFVRGEILKVEFAFRFDLPKKFLNNDGSQKINAPLYFGTKPDLTNLTACVEDAVQVYKKVGEALLYHDDSQIAIHQCLKRYVLPDEVPGVSILVRRIPDGGGEDA